MRPWGEHLRAAGFNVVAPLLPGHGGTWQDLSRTGWDDWMSEVEQALKRAESFGRPVFAAGLSMGGSLTLRLAELHQERLRGLVLVNPAIVDSTPHGFLTPFIHRVVPSVGSIGSDIKKPDKRESTTDRTPLASYASLRRGWKATRRDLDRIHLPMRIFTSVDDHVVSPRNSAVIRSQVSSTDIVSTSLLHSYHVATLDWDAELIFRQSAEFIRAYSSDTDSDKELQSG